MMKAPSKHGFEGSSEDLYQSCDELSRREFIHITPKQKRIPNMETNAPVYTNRKAKSEGGEIEISNPVFGETGWRKKDDGTWEELRYDSKSKTPEWIPLAAFRAAKEARSKLWKKSEGPKDWKMRHGGSDESYFGRGAIGCYS